MSSTMSKRIAKLPPVNCGGCRTCCIDDTITLHPSDNPADFDHVEFPDGHRELAKGKNGQCVYLGKKGCTIYDRQPFMCRAFDCRGLVLKFEKMMAAEQRQRLDSPQYVRVLAEGTRRLRILRAG